MEKYRFLDVGCYPVPACLLDADTFEAGSPDIWTHWVPNSQKVCVKADSDRGCYSPCFEACFRGIVADAQGPIAQADGLREVESLKALSGLQDWFPFEGLFPHRCWQVALKELFQ